MRYLAIAAILVGACQTPEKLPEGRSGTDVLHAEFATIRPTSIAIRKVESSSRPVSRELRDLLYDGLFEKNYSCLRLQTVDKRTDSKGVIDPRLGWDAVFETKITRWQRWHGDDKVVASGHAQMVAHGTGEILWKMSFQDELFDVDVSAGQVDYTKAIRGLSRHILKFLPEHPAGAPPK